MVRRLVATLSALAALSPLQAARAGAQAYELGWWLKASGSVQVVADANHLWAVGYDNQGNQIGRLWDVWLDWYCRVGAVTSGDDAGTPFRIRLESPAGSGAGCLPSGDGTPNYWTQFYGWSTGTGTWSGQNWYSPYYVAEYTVYVFPRDAATVESRGTLVEIY